MVSLEIRERVWTEVLPIPREQAFGRLVAKLEDAGMEIIIRDNASYEIVAHGFCVLTNWILWRCYADKLLFRLREEQQGSRLDVFAIPNLLTYRPPAGGARSAEAVVGDLLSSMRLP